MEDEDNAAERGPGAAAVVGLFGKSDISFVLVVLIFAGVCLGPGCATVHDSVAVTIKVLRVSDAGNHQGTFVTAQFLAPPTLIHLLVESTPSGDAWIQPNDVVRIHLKRSFLEALERTGEVVAVSYRELNPKLVSRRSGATESGDCR